MRIHLANSGCKLLDVLFIEFGSAECCLPASLLTLRRVGLAFLFRLIECLLFNQQPLAFIPFAGTTPFQYDRGELGVLSRPASQSGITGRQECEVIEVGAGETRCLLLTVEDNPSAASELLAALVAGNFATGDEYLEFVFGFPAASHNVLVGCLLCSVVLVHAL
jgi:hypothetical protein